MQALIFIAIVVQTRIDAKTESHGGRQADAAVAQAREAAAQTALQRAALVESNRPQIDLGKPIPSGLVWTSTGARLIFDEDVVNAGGSPALKVRLAIHSSEPPPPPSIHTPTDDRCTLLTDDTLVRADLGHVMKAGGVRRLKEYRVGFTASDIADAAKDRPTDAAVADPMSVGYLRFVACVAYKRTGWDTFWSARKEFVLGRKSPGDDNAIMPIRMGDNLAADDLVLREGIQGNYSE